MSAGGLESKRHVVCVSDDEKDDARWRAAREVAKSIL